jgi:hypothetical protein
MALISSRELQQEPEKADRLLKDGPVFVTDKGETAYVLLSIADYRKLAGKGKSITELLGMDDDMDFDPQKLDDSLIHPAALCP